MLIDENDTSLTIYPQVTNNLLSSLPLARRQCNNARESLQELKEIFFGNRYNLLYQRVIKKCLMMKNFFERIDFGKG